MSEPSFETLEEFKDWLISPEGPGVLSAVPVKAPMVFVDGAAAVTIYRRGCFQAELFYGSHKKAYTITPSEQAELASVFVGGEVSIELKEGGRGGISEEESLQQLEADENPFEVPSSSRGLYISYLAGIPVSFSFGTNGGVFLVLTKQREGTPDSCLKSVEIADIPTD